MNALFKVNEFKKKYQQDFMLLKLDELRQKNRNRIIDIEKNKEYQRKYYKLNKEQHKKRMKDYQQKNKEKLNAYQREYRKKKKQLKEKL